MTTRNYYTEATNRMVIMSPAKREDKSSLTISIPACYKKPLLIAAGWAFFTFGIPLVLLLMLGYGTLLYHFVMWIDGSYVNQRDDLAGFISVFGTVITTALVGIWTTYVITEIK